MIDDAEIPNLRTTLWAHQREAVAFARPRAASMLALEMGCVSGDTEFLSPAGWKRIDAWAGESVASFDPKTGTARFEMPSRYIVRPQEKMIELSHSRGLSQVLTPDHRVLWYDDLGNTREDESRNLPATGKILGAFRLHDGTGIDLTDEQIRVQVAVQADGYFPKKSANPMRCRIRVRKERKIKRLRKLLKDAKIPYRESRAYPDPYRLFVFSAPIRAKRYGSEWWATTLHQREILADELFRWDGSYIQRSKSLAFFSDHQEDAEFVQFVYASTGRRCSIRFSQRRRRDRIVREWATHTVGNGRTGNYYRFVRKLGHFKPIVSDDGFAYCFTVSTGFLVLRHRGSIFVTGNCGKSLVALALAELWERKRILIACPLSVAGVWPREIEQHLHKPWAVARLDKGSVRAKQAEAERVVNLASARGETCAVVVNHESLWRRPFGDWAGHAGFDLLVVDESQRAKAPGGKFSRYLIHLARVIPRRLALTGTPCPHSILDAYAQFRFLDRNVFGISFVRFRDRYGVMGGYEKRQVVGYKNLPEFEERFARIAIQQKKEDALDLPPEVDEERYTALEPKAWRAYQQLEANFVAAVEAGTVTASNALVKLLRLQQVTSGVLQTDAGTETEISTAKRDLLRDVLADCPRPVVVFARFRSDLDAIRSVGDSLGLRVGELSGREKCLTDDARLPENIDLLATQIQAGGVGVDLSRSSTAIYYSMGFSLGDYLQSRSRLHRPGQENRVLFLHLVVENTIDGEVLKALRRREAVVESILQAARSFRRYGGKGEHRGRSDLREARPTQT